MKVGQLGRLLVTFGLLVFCGCTFNEPRIRSEPLLFFPTSAAAPTPTPTLTLGKVPLHCVETAGLIHRWILDPFFSSGSSQLDECVYQTANVEELEKALTNDATEAEKNNTEKLMMAVSNQNCNNFRAKIFAFRANAGVVSSTTSTLLASGGAIAALASGPVGAGLAGGSAGLQAAMGNISGQFYQNFGEGQLDQNITSSIVAKGLCIQKKMDAAVSTSAPGSAAQANNAAQAAAAVPGATPTPDSCPTPANNQYAVGDRINDLQNFDAACSLEEAAKFKAQPTPTPGM